MSGMALWVPRKVNFMILKRRKQILILKIDCRRRTIILKLDSLVDLEQFYEIFIRKLVINNVKVDIINRYNNLLYHLSCFFSCWLEIQKIRNTYAIE